MIRIHLVRQVQTSHCDFETRCKSLDVEIPKLETLLDASEDGGWTFVGIELLPKAGGGE